MTFSFYAHLLKVEAAQIRQKMDLRIRAYVLVEFFLQVTTCICMSYACGCWHRLRWCVVGGGGVDVNAFVVL